VGFQCANENRYEIPEKILDGISQEIILSPGAKPVFGSIGPPTSIGCPYPPTIQPLPAATRTQIGRFAGREFIVVENPVTFVLYNH
jgi:hypothetical protein